MNKADCFHLGYIAKLHGYKGEVSLFLDVSNPGDYAGLDAFFVDINDQLTPFFVEHLKLKNKGFAAVKLEGVDSEADARLILRKSVYLPAQILPELEGNHFYDHEVIGFEVIDMRYGKVGVLGQVIDFKSNPLLQVEGPNGEEVLIPLQKDTVLEIDRENKRLTIQSPEGLIELYLD